MPPSSCHKSLCTLKCIIQEKQAVMPVNATATPSNDDDTIQETSKALRSLKLADKHPSPADKHPSPADKRPSPADDDEGGPLRNQLCDAVDKFWSWFGTALGAEKNQPRIVIAFDEAHSLSQATSADISPSHILCRTIRWFSAHEKPIWVLFASTNPRIADFSAPAKSRTSSFRNDIPQS